MPDSPDQQTDSREPDVRADNAPATPDDETAARDRTRRKRRRHRIAAAVMTLVSLLATWFALSWMLNETAPRFAVDVEPIEGRYDAGTQTESDAALEQLLDPTSQTPDDPSIAPPIDITPPGDATRLTHITRAVGSVAEVITSYDIGSAGRDAVRDHFAAQFTAQGFTQVVRSQQDSPRTDARVTEQLMFVRHREGFTSDDILTLRIRTLDGARVRAVLWLRYPMPDRPPAPAAESD